MLKMHGVVRVVPDPAIFILVSWLAIGKFIGGFNTFSGNVYVVTVQFLGIFLQ